VGGERGPKAKKQHHAYGHSLGLSKSEKGKCCERKDSHHGTKENIAYPFTGRSGGTPEVGLSSRPDSPAISEGNRERKEEVSSKGKKSLSGHPPHPLLGKGEEIRTL